MSPVVESYLGAFKALQNGVHTVTLYGDIGKHFVQKLSKLFSKVGCQVA